MDRSSLTQEELINSFNYKDGFLYRKYSRPTKNANKPSGSLTSYGYWEIKFNYTSYLAHRLIFLYHHGYLPEFIDHIDGDPLNNKINNLRPATTSQNQYNKKVHKTNKLGIKGVYLHKITGKFEARISANGVRQYLGLFKSADQAGEAYKKASIQKHGEFSIFNLNKGVMS